MLNLPMVQKPTWLSESTPLIQEFYCLWGFQQLLLSHLDYVNVLCIVAPEYNLCRLQWIQNIGARILKYFQPLDPISPTLHLLYWSPAKRVFLNPSEASIMDYMEMDLPSYKGSFRPLGPDAAFKQRLISDKKSKGSTFSLKQKIHGSKFWFTSELLMIIWISLKLLRPNCHDTRFGRLLLHHHKIPQTYQILTT